MPRRAEVLLGLTGAAAGAIAAATFDDGPLRAVTGAALGGLLGTSRDRPRATWLAALAALALQAATAPSAALTPFGPDPEGSFAAFLLLLVHALLIGYRETSRGALAGLVALAGTSILLDVLGNQLPPGFVAVLLAGMWAAGRGQAKHQRLAGRLAARAHDLDREREAHAQLSVRYERARIASELHDIVAHALSVMVVQATAGQRLVTVDEQATAQTFESIAAAAHEAEQDIERLVALLGDREADQAAPDLELVDELVRRAAGSGLDVTLVLDGAHDELPAPLAALAYRVVQEGLTNALRHASGAAVRVTLRHDPDALLVEVADDGATASTALAGAGTGNGLRGLRERIGAAGGALHAGPNPGGGFRLAARLPRSATAPVGAPQTTHGPLRIK